MPATVKTAVSLRKELFTRAEAAAGQMRVPRSRLFSLALESFLDRRENAQILERLDAAYAGEASPEESDLKSAMLSHQRRFLRKRR